jgi:endonuclease YncB( thermonuclease family)
VFKHATPHLFGTVTYAGKHDFRPDGDTIHLRSPVLIDAGGVHKPVDGAIEVAMPGREPQRIPLRPGKAPSYLPIRLSGIDAPEQHYRGTGLELSRRRYRYERGQGHTERSQPQWEAATDFLVGRLQAARWCLIEIDRDVVDPHGRVLGYVYESDRNAGKGKFLTLELLQRGLAFPFVFESAEDHMRPFLAAGARARAARAGVWARYSDAPLPFSQTYDAPSSYDVPEPPAQKAGRLNLPVVFRRVVDVEQLSGGLTLQTALRKYDCIDADTGKLVTGDHYQEIPIDNRVWAPHEYRR